jgi:hypothetical protein
MKRRESYSKTVSTALTILLAVIVVAMSLMTTTDRSQAATTSVTVGSSAVARALYSTVGYTRIAVTNPANTSGSITSIQMYNAGPLVGVIVGTFYGSGTSYSIRDHATIGSIGAGSQTITTDVSGNSLSINVSSGDYIGYYFSAGGSGGTNESLTGGNGVYYILGDSLTSGGMATYALASGHEMSIGGFGSSSGTATMSTPTSTPTFNSTSSPSSPAPIVAVPSSVGTIALGTYGTLAGSGQTWTDTAARYFASSKFKWLWLQPSYPYTNNMGTMGSILKNAGKKVILRTFFSDNPAIVSAGYTNWDTFYAGGTTAVNLAVSVISSQINNIGLSQVYGVTIEEEEPAQSGGSTTHYISSHNSITAALKTAYPGLRVIGTPSGLSDTEVKQLNIDGLFWYTYGTANSSYASFLSRGLAIATSMKFGVPELYTLVSSELSSAEQWAPDTHPINISAAFDMAVGLGYQNVGFYCSDGSGHELLNYYTPDYSSTTPWRNAFQHKAEVEKVIGRVDYTN